MDAVSRAREGAQARTPAPERAVTQTAAEIFAAQLRRSLPTSVAAQIEPAIDAARAHSGALAAQDRLAAQILSIANVAGGRLSSLRDQ